MNNDTTWMDRGLQAGQIFTPTSPIDERSLFAGREEQVRQVVDVVSQKGQHAMLYGERGVGKTSLANVLSTFLGNPSAAVLSPRVNCDASDTFETVWRKIFNQIHLTTTKPAVGFAGQSGTEFSSPLPQGVAITPDVVRQALTRLSHMALPILIVDEFDRLSDEPRRVFADTIKSLSDHAVRATVILVGVADSVEGLIREHLSVERALVQIRMPRMSEGEISQIAVTGLQRLGMRIHEDALSRVVLLSQGLPHYTHLVCLHASRAAIDNRSTVVSLEHVRVAINKAITAGQQSIRSAYELAVRSPKKDNLFTQVLLACALAKPNEVGFFAAQDVREPIRQITGRSYEIPSFAQHLNEFSDFKRGHILQKTGTARRYRYRFSNPLMQPFVVMQGLSSGLLSDDALSGKSLPLFPPK